MMAEASGGSLDLASLVRANGVEGLHFTVCCGPVKFLVWTRLSDDGSLWIITATDGVDVWLLQLDQEQLDSHRELAEIDKYETYFTRFRSQFQKGNLSVAQLANKVTLTVGSGISSLYYNLYESKASERKTELQTLLFRLADRVSELTEELKVSNESLERLKTQKDTTTAGSSIFEIPPKKTSQAPPVKRKQGHSLINPGSRKEPEVGVVDGENTEHNVHISVLARDQMLDIYKCTDVACEHYCTKTNKRYHCPLCNNKPQKPGRMHRHFEKMHAGKQIVQHEGYQMLRCKLRCIKANGRSTDNSHYHCCLCGRVLLRKVHLYCHLQAHSFGSMHEIDEMLDAKDDTEEGPIEDPEVEDDDDDVGDHDTTLDTTEISELEDPEGDNVVSLSDGTQVVFVQSIQDNETLTVVPLNGEPDTLQLAQPVHHSDVTTVVSSASDLNTGMEALNSEPSRESASDLENVQEQLPPQLTVKQVEAMLNQSDQDTAPMQVESSQRDLATLGQEITGLEAYSSQETPNMTSDIGIGQTTTSPTKLPDTSHEPMEFESCLHGLPMPEADNTTIGTTSVSSLEQETSQISREPAVPEALAGQSAAIQTMTTQLVTTATPVKMIQMPASTSSVQESKNSMITFQGESSSSHGGRRQQASHQDSLVLVDVAASPQGDDHVFKALLTNVAPATNCFNHPSVLSEKISMDVRRCKNTDCDCRLYHCPLCTCLPNKPGRIREHFKKIHGQDLVVRYQGWQMLRCKLGCCRPSGKKVFNSHYHCCLCGSICMRKSGVYEHMRVNHSTAGTRAQPVSKESLSGAQLKHETAQKQMAQVPSGLEGSENQEVQSTQPQTSVGGTPVQQSVTVQIPQHGLAEGQAQQQVVILMPQQMNQGQVQGPAQSPQQPIVIVMPQTGGAQFAQPIVVPMPQPSCN